MKYFVVPLSVLLFSLAAWGQAIQQTNDSERDKSGFLPSQSPPPATVSAPLTIAAPTDTNTPSGIYLLDDKHKLMPNDRISFRILEDRGTNANLMVTESTELDIPYIGRISVVDKTCKQLADDLRILLEKDYYYKATVVIGLDSMGKVLGKVYVWGPVRRPGPIDIPANEVFTAGKAILRAEGFGDFANKKEVKVIRKSANGNITFKINMVDVLEKGKTEADIPLEPEDFIIVPQRAWNM